MAQTSYFFDSVGGDRVYSAGSFADWMYQIISRSEGVLDGLDSELAVSSSGGLAANIATGIATKGGRVYKNDSVASPALDTVSIGYKRIDRIVIRFDAVTARSAVATIIKGTEVLIANGATAPAITSGTDVLLAQVLITNNGGTYSYAYTDERVYFRFNLNSIPSELTGKNAPTATILQTARTIGGVSFNGSANINLPGVNTTGNQNTSGSSASCTGNAATATILQTARTIGGVSFNGSANINLPGVNTTGNQDTSGNAATATNADQLDGQHGSYYTDPRNQYHGAQVGSPSQNSIFDVMSPFIPTTGNVMLCSGVIVVSATEYHILSRATRTNSTRISLSSLKYTLNAGAITNMESSSIPVDDGNSTTYIADISF